MIENLRSSDYNATGQGLMTIVSINRRGSATSLLKNLQEQNISEDMVRRSVNMKFKSV